MKIHKIGNSIRWKIPFTLTVDGIVVSSFGNYSLTCGFKGRNRKFQYTPAEVTIEGNAFIVTLNATHHWIEDTVDMDITIRNNNQGWEKTTETVTFKTRKKISQ